MIWKRNRPGRKEHAATIEPVTQFVDAPKDDDEPEQMDRVVRVNVRLLLVTFVVLIVAATGVHFLHGYWLQKNADSLLERADAAEAEERYSDAISALTQYLNLQPQTALNDDEEQQITDILERLAGLVQKQDTTRNQQLRLFRTFEDILRRDPTRWETRRQLVDVCMRLALFRDAVRHIDTLLDHPAAVGPESDTSQAELLRLKGDCLQALEEYRSSAIAYVQSIAADPTDPEGYTRAASLAARHPREMPSRQQLDSISGNSIPDVTDAFPASSDSRSNWGDSTPLALIDQMVATAQPAWRTHLLKSQFLLSTLTGDEAPALDEANANRRADSVFLERDADEDGILDPVEANHASIPPLTDADSDGQIDRSELVRRLMLGDRLARLQAALTAAQQAVALAETTDSPTVLTRTLRNAADVNLALANAAAFEADEDPETYRTAAQEFLERALETDRADPQIYVSLARLERQQLATGMPEEDIRRHLEISVQHLRDGLEQVRQLSADADDATGGNGDSEEAARVDDAINVQAVETELLWSLADTLVALSNFSDNREELLTEVREMIPRLEEAGARDALTDFLQAQLLMAEEQWRPALGILTQLSTMKLAGAFGRRVALLRSRCLRELELPDSAVNLFTGQVQQDPLWIEGRVELARAMAASGQMQRAIDEYRRIVGAPGVAAALGRLLLVQQSSLPADRKNISELERVIGLIPEDAVPDRALLTAELQLLRARTLAQLAKPEETEADKLARMEQAVAELDAASTTLQDAIADHPDNAELRSAYATLLLQRFDRPVADRLAAAERYLQEAVEDIGDRVPFRLAAVQAATALPRDQAIASLVELETDLQKFSREDQQSLRSGLARGYATIGDFDRAIAHWQAIAATDPNALEPRLAILQLMIAAQQQSDIESSAGDDIWNATLAEVREIETATDRDEPGGPSGASRRDRVVAPNASYFEAVRLILDAAKRDEDKEAKLQRARTLLERARQERPMWSAIPRALGDIEVMLGNRALAIEHYEKAFSLGDRTPQMIGRIAQYHFSLLTPEGIERAGRLMDELRAENPNLISEDLARLQWRIDWRRSQFQNALSVLEDLANRSDDLNDRLRWLWAQLLTGQQSEDIEQLIEELAEQFGSESPEVWQLWTAYLVRSGRMDDAIAVIEQAKKKLPDQPPHLKPLAIAGYLELLRFTDNELLQKYRAETERYYRLALEAAPDSTTVALPLAHFYIGTKQFAKARPLLDGILASPDAPEPARDWARRNKALLIASSGRYDDTTRALELLSSAPDGSNLSASDLRAELLILQRRNVPSERQRRIDLLDSLAQLTTLTNQEQLLKARLLELTGRWPEALKTYEELLATSPRNAFVIARFTEALIRQYELDHAEEMIARLNEVSPDSFMQVLLETRLLVAQDRQDEAVPLIRDFLGQLEETAAPDAALKDLILQGEVEAAIDELQQITTADRDHTAARNLAEAKQLLEMGNKEAALKIIEAVLYNSEQKHAIHGFYYRTAARILAEIGAFAEAETIYRDYLTRSDNTDERLGLATYLVHQGRIDEALQLCDDAWQDCSPIAVANTSVAILREPEAATDERITQVDARLKAAIRAHGSQTPAVAAQIMFHLADLRDLQERYDDAIKLYEGILRLAPDHLATRNNLAWMLAMKGRDLDRAAHLIQTTIDEVGPKPTLIDTRGTIHLAAGDTSAAISDFREALAATKAPTTRFHLAVALLADNKPQEAEQEYAAAVADGFTPDSLHPLEQQVYAQQIALLRTARRASRDSVSSLSTTSSEATPVTHR